MPKAHLDARNAKLDSSLIRPSVQHRLSFASPSAPRAFGENEPHRGDIESTPAHDRSLCRPADAEGSLGRAKRQTRLILDTPERPTSPVLCFAFGSASLRRERAASWRYRIDTSARSKLVQTGGCRRLTWTRETPNSTHP